MSKEKNSKKTSKFISLDVELGQFGKTSNKGIVRGVCKVAYAGKNRNGSVIDRDVFDKAESSLAGIPVVGHWLGDNFGGHDIILEQKGNELTFRENTIAYGFVPQDCNPRWETQEDGNGNSKQYLLVDVCLWERKYPEEIGFIKKNGVNQSMEITIEDYDWTNEDYLDVRDFYYNALCILGRDAENPEKNVEPCFEDAEISFSIGSNILNQLKEMEQEFVGGVKVEKEFETEVVETVEEVIEETPVVDEVEEVEDFTEETQDETPSVEEVEEIVEEVVESETDFETENKELKEELEKVMARVSELEVELSNVKNINSELETYKATKEQEEELAKKEEVLSEYSLVFGKTQLEKLVNKDMSVEEMQSKLALEFSKMSIEKAKSEKVKSVAYGIKEDVKISMSELSSDRAKFGLGTK